MRCSNNYLDTIDNAYTTVAISQGELEAIEKAYGKKCKFTLKYDRNQNLMRLVVDENGRCFALNKQSRRATQYRITFNKNTRPRSLNHDVWGYGKDISATLNSDGLSFNPDRTHKLRRQKKSAKKTKMPITAKKAAPRPAVKTQYKHTLGAAIIVIDAYLEKNPEMDLVRLPDGKHTVQLKR